MNILSSWIWAVQHGTASETIKTFRKHVFGSHMTRCDECLRASMQAVVELLEIRKSVLPHIQTSGNPEIRKSGFPEIWKSGYPDFRKSGYPEVRISENRDIRISGNPDIRIFGYPDIRIFGPNSFFSFRRG